MTAEKVYYLGADLGSSYTKLVVIDDQGNPVHSEVMPTLTRRRNRLDESLRSLHERFTIAAACATGYGRSSLDWDLKKTELVCAATGAAGPHPFEKTIIDIGGEDIKIIESGGRGEIRNFYMNDKCSAGTGAFISEIAAKVELEISEMSALARASSTNRALNSFCTVFAKTEMLGWKFEDVPLEDMARGIYMSIVTRLSKLPIRADLPVLLCGGVIAYHPYLAELLTGQLGLEVRIADEPQFVAALGAALQASRHGQAQSAELKTEPLLT
ncbi:MAG: acyl-CoA dehydratase activase [Candidatus Neomarinimicrobiota bacterium]